MAFFDKLFGKKETPREAAQRGQNLVKQNRSNAKAIISKLNSIDFYSADNKLDPEIIKEAAYIGLCANLEKDLEDPAEITRDISGLDEILEYAADALGEAVRNGHPTKAHWAAAALYKGIKELRKEITGTEAGHEAAVYEKRLEYAKTLKLIVDQASQLDKAEISLKEQQDRYDVLQKEIATLKENFTRYVQTPEGSTALANMNLFAANPEMMSENAKNLAAQSNEVKSKEDVAKAAYKQIMTLREQVQAANTQISIARNLLSMGVSIIRPEQLAETQRMLEHSVTETTARLDEIQKQKSLTKKYFDDMDLLGHHPVLLDSAAAAVKAANALKNENAQELTRRAQVLEQMRRDQWNEKIAREILEAAQKRYEHLEDPVVVHNKTTNVDTNEDQNFIPAQ